MEDGINKSDSTASSTSTGYLITCSVRQFRHFCWLVESFANVVFVILVLLTFLIDSQISKFTDIHIEWKARDSSEEHNSNSKVLKLCL